MITIQISATDTHSIVHHSGELREGILPMIEAAIQFHNYTTAKETITRDGKCQLKVSVEKSDSEDNKP